MADFLVTEIMDAAQNGEAAIIKACGLLSAGEVIGFPTETVYGIGADIFNTGAVKKIFEAKDRRQSNPLAAHISSTDQVPDLCLDISDEFYILAEKFLPGPLSIVMKKNSIINDIVTAGKSTLAIRFPANKTALDLIGRYGKPLAATSANISGRPSPVTAGQVHENLKGRIPLIIDAGPCDIGLESTVLNLADGKPSILRQGAISRQELEEVLKIKLND